MMTTALPAKLDVSSPSFKNQAYIPSKFTCEGDEVNPAIRVNDIPKEAKSLVLIVDDPDAPHGTFDHWVVWNIPVQGKIKENSVPGVMGKNGTGTIGYKGPCPPTGTHRYFFKVYALDTKLPLDMGADKATVEKAMEGHILATGELVGLYKKMNP